MRLGVIGCGNISLNHHLPACQAEPGVEIVAAADATPARLALFGTAAGLEAARCVPDAADVLARRAVPRDAQFPGRRRSSRRGGVSTSLAARSAHEWRRSADGHAPRRVHPVLA